MITPYLGTCPKTKQKVFLLILLSGSYIQRLDGYFLNFGDFYNESKRFSHYRFIWSGKRQDFGESFQEVFDRYIKSFPASINWLKEGF